MAGEVSKYLTKRILLPEDIVKAHEEGLIHFHDADYFAQHMHNCDLVNLEDMLENGTVCDGAHIGVDVKAYDFIAAEKAMTENKITSLLVTDEADRLVGVIQIYDIKL